LPEVAFFKPNSTPALPLIVNGLRQFIPVIDGARLSTIESRRPESNSAYSPPFRAKFLLLLDIQRQALDP